MLKAKNDNSGTYFFLRKKGRIPNIANFNTLTKTFEKRESEFYSFVTYGHLMDKLDSTMASPLVEA